MTKLFFYAFSIIFIVKFVKNIVDNYKNTDSQSKELNSSIITSSDFSFLFRSYKEGFFYILMSIIGYVVIIITLIITAERYTNDIKFLTNTQNIIGEITNRINSLTNIFESLKIIGYMSTASLFFGVFKLYYSTYNLLK